MLIEWCILLSMLVPFENQTFVLPRSLTIVKSNLRDLFTHVPEINVQRLIKCTGNTNKSRQTHSQAVGI